jgi:hypothetical protein
MTNKIINKGSSTTDVVKKFKLRAKKWTAVGSVIIFLSWISQNYFQDKWHQEVARIERNKLAIGFNEVNKNAYQIFMNEEKYKELNDTNYKGNLVYAYHAYDIYSNLLQYLGTTLTSDDSNFLKENETIFRGNIDDLTEWGRKGEVSKLKSFAERVSKWESENGMNTIWTYQTILSEMRNKEEWWSKAYIILYVFGAFCLGYAFIIDYRLTKTGK